ncbi:hypothetical protein B0H19DRAFT_1233592 [Mycena capillaripes]|nr:hypothetical protein B0H19DRAFT_1233592 [Mycena capillaripes]
MFSETREASINLICAPFFYPCAATCVGPVDGGSSILPVFFATAHIAGISLTNAAPEPSVTPGIGSARGMLVFDPSCRAGSSRHNGRRDTPQIADYSASARASTTVAAVLHHLSEHRRDAVKDLLGGVFCMSKPPLRGPHPLRGLSSSISHTLLLATIAAAAAASRASDTSAACVYKAIALGVGCLRRTFACPYFNSVFSSNLSVVKCITAGVCMGAKGVSSMACTLTWPWARTITPTVYMRICFLHPQPLYQEGTVGNRRKGKEAVVAQQDTMRWWGLCRQEQESECEDGNRAHIMEKGTWTKAKAIFLVSAEVTAIWSRDSADASAQTGCMYQPCNWLNTKYYKSEGLFGV